MALRVGARSLDKLLQFLGARDFWDGIWWPSLVRVCVVGRHSFFRPVSFPNVCLYAHVLSPSLWGFSAKAGTQVVVPFRDEEEKRHLKVMGDLGQIVPMVRRTQSLSSPDAS
jgi:hypothetical protein